MNKKSVFKMTDLINSNNSVLLLIDHQSGLLQTVKDIDITTLRKNLTALCRTATLLNIPVISTASVPEGPNGPILPEIKKYAPHEIFIKREGEINAWENEDFVNAVRSTNKNTLIIAGVWTSVCVAFPTLSALAEGYKVYTVVDSSGDVSMLSTQLTIARVTQAGAIAVSSNAIIAELQKTWKRDNSQEFLKIYEGFSPAYNAVTESYHNVQKFMQQSKM